MASHVYLIFKGFAVVLRFVASKVLAVAEVVHHSFHPCVKDYANLCGHVKDIRVWPQDFFELGPILVTG